MEFGKTGSAPQALGVPRGVNLNYSVFSADSECLGMFKVGTDNHYVVIK